MTQVSLKPNHYAVYVLNETTDRYGEPIMQYLDRPTAQRVAESLVNVLYPDGGSWTEMGFVRKGRPGSPSYNVLIWDMKSRRD